VELRYLDFDISDDEDGATVFDAMASVGAAQWPALCAEVEAVLAWAEQAFAGARAPLDDGGEWDFVLDAAQEARTPVALAWDEGSGRLSARLGTPGPARHSLSFSLTGSAGFTAALREAFALG